MKNVWLNGDGDLKAEILEFCEIYFKDLFGKMDDEGEIRVLADEVYEDVRASEYYSPAFLYMRLMDLIEPRFETL